MQGENQHPCIENMVARLAWKSNLGRQGSGRNKVERGTGRSVAVGLGLCQETGVEETTQMISNESLTPQKESCGHLFTGFPQ